MSSAYLHVIMARAVVFKFISRLWVSCIFAVNIIYIGGGKSLKLGPADVQWGQKPGEVHTVLPQKSNLKLGFGKFRSFFSEQPVGYNSIEADLASSSSLSIPVSQ